MLGVIRAILRKAEREWEWIERAPIIRMLKEDTKRIKRLTHEEAARLINELPSHIADMAQAKTKKAIPVPLNETAIEIIRKQIGKNFRKVLQCNTKAWKKTLKRAGIKDFRWHDLRHTWASWHVQSGTSLRELQQLGGWTSFEMVLRYAHLSSDHLRSAAERVRVTNWLQSSQSALENLTVSL